MSVQYVSYSVVIHVPLHLYTKKKVITDLRVWKNSTNTHKQQQFYGSLWLKFSEMYAKYGTYNTLYNLC